MHIKSKYELNFAHIAILAICPLMLVVKNLNSGIVVMCLTLISFIMSLFVCLILARKSSRNIKIFVSAFVSSFVVAIFELLVKNGIFESIGNISYYSILSTIILCIDSFYIDSNAMTKNYLIKAIRLLFVYSFVLLIYVVIKEILAFGTIAGFRILNFAGYAFFELITFDFLLLGLLSAIVNRISNYIIKTYNENIIVYNKYKVKVRNEKTFLYENYRRKKLLSSDVIMNHVGSSKRKEESSYNEENNKSSESRRSVIKHKPRRKSKLRVSKEARIEKIFDRKGIVNKEDVDNA